MDDILEKLPKLTDKAYFTEFKEIIVDFKKIIFESQIADKELFLQKLDGFESVLENNITDHNRFFDVSNFLLKSEFKITDLKLNSDTDIQFHGKSNNCKFSYNLHYDESEWGFKVTNGDLNSFNVEKVIYIDSPSIFDIKGINGSVLKIYPYHLRFLSRMLNSSINDFPFNYKLDQIKDEINTLVGGNIYFDDKKHEFIFDTYGDVFSMRSTAASVKQLGIIQILLSNHTLGENSILIMNEAEVNLHPEW